MPVAEPGAPEAYDEIQTARFDVAGVDVYVDRELLGADVSWTIDTDGFARWRRLVVLGVDLAPH